MGEIIKFKEISSIVDCLQKEYEKKIKKCEVGIAIRVALDEWQMSVIGTSIGLTIRDLSNHKNYWGAFNVVRCLPKGRLPNFHYEIYGSPKIERTLTMKQICNEVEILFEICIKKIKLIRRKNKCQEKVKR